MRPPGWTGPRPSGPTGAAGPSLFFALSRVGRGGVEMPRVGFSSRAWPGHGEGCAVSMAPGVSGTWDVGSGHWVRRCVAVGWLVMVKHWRASRQCHLRGVVFAGARCVRTKMPRRSSPARAIDGAWKKARAGLPWGQFQQPPRKQLRKRLTSSRSQTPKGGAISPQGRPPVKQAMKAPMSVRSRTPSALRSQGQGVAPHPES